MSTTEATLWHGFTGEEAVIADFLMLFLTDKETNRHCWHEEYRDLYQYFLPSETGDYPIPLQNLVRLDWVQRKWSEQRDVRKLEYCLELRNVEITVLGDVAKVTLQALSSFRYENQLHGSGEGPDYHIVLQRTDVGWLIREFVDVWGQAGHEPYLGELFDEVAYLTRIGIDPPTPTPSP